MCGNKVCEGPYETCANCNQDCGSCEVIGCLEVVNCALGCLDLGSLPPKFSLSCIANCTAQGCADVQYFVDEFINCAIANIGNCLGDGGGIGCIQKACDAELAACIGAKC